MYLKRDIEDIILKLSDEFPVVILSGPRQVGKSTVLQMIKKNNMNYVSLDDLDARQLALTDPKYFLEYYTYPLFIDEIQYAPNLLPYIKIRVDEQRLDCLKNDKKEECLFWLTGSQQFSLMKGVSESLAGRAGILNLSSLSIDEISQRKKGIFHPDINKLKQVSLINPPEKNTTEIFEMIFRGGMPGVVAKNVSRDSFYSSYVQTYIERDIKALSNVGKTIEFYNFLQFLAARTAQELEYSSISKEIGVDAGTVKRWISILETSGIIYLIRPYSANASNRIIKSPKLYFMDTGLCTWLTKWPDSKTLEAGAMAGAIFETYAVSEIIKNFYNYGKNPNNYFYYYRDKDQKEIDLLFVEENKIYPIEIKKGISPNHPDKNFKVLEKYKQEIMAGIVICMTKELLPINKNCWLCPVELI